MSVYIDGCHVGQALPASKPRSRAGATSTDRLGAGFGKPACIWRARQVRIGSGVCLEFESLFSLFPLLAGYVPTNRRSLSS